MSCHASTILPVLSPGAPAHRIPRHTRPLGGDTARWSAGEVVVRLEGMILDNGTASRQLAPLRKPAWIRARVPAGDGYRRLRDLLAKHELHTVCSEASCPNIGECWNRGTATIMILGDTCTRSCGFCNVRTGRPLPPDPDEPRRVAESVRLMGLRHVVITCVDRDDLPDGGAAFWAETIRRVRTFCPDTSIEALVGDFRGDERALHTVIEARPDILAHNLETVRRMHPTVRPQARYERTMTVLQQIRDAGLVSKTGIMVGIGETDDEGDELLVDVQERAGTPLMTIGQYLQPSRNHLPIDRWVDPAQFEAWHHRGLALGYRVVESGPLVRSSYHAEEQVDALRANSRVS